MTLLKARPTTYNGVQMRSRLEARVAAWLDEKGIGWEYETRAFGSGRKQYLPDFDLGFDGLDRRTFLEVKGALSKGEESTAQERMDIILRSHSDAVLALATCADLELGWLRLRCGKNDYWHMALVPELFMYLGHGVCDHYRLPEYGS